MTWTAILLRSYSGVVSGEYRQIDPELVVEHQKLIKARPPLDEFTKAEQEFVDRVTAAPKSRNALLAGELIVIKRGLAKEPQEKTRGQS